MKKVLIALFVALVLFCASGGLERFASMADDHVTGAVSHQ
jgi:hypothetical protein